MSPHLIRMWERRYGAVVPGRTQSRQRLYTDEDIERLLLLRRATEAGESIGQIARLPSEELESLLREAARTGRVAHSPAGSAPQREAVSQVVEDALAAVTALDPERLSSVLSQAMVDLGQSVLLAEVLLPLMERVGSLWQEGKLKVVHEHAASAVLRTILGEMVQAHRAPAGAPALVVTTPSGQNHEYGALAATVVAAAQGWRALYLGPSMPADDVAHAVKNQKARVLLLSIVYPDDDPLLDRELLRLRRLLGGDVRIIVGGRGVDRHREVLAEIGAAVSTSIRELPLRLNEARAV